MTISLDVPIRVDAEVRICGVYTGMASLVFDASADGDGDILIEICEDDFIRIAKERYGLVEATDD